MRYLLIFWALPTSVFWGWYFLSLNDMNFGYLFLSRDVHDLAFQLYGNILGIDPALIPGLVGRACIVDTFLIAAIIAFRNRGPLIAWGRARWERYRAEKSAPAVRSRSSAP